MDNDVQGHEDSAAWGERRCSSSHGHTGMAPTRQRTTPVHTQSTAAQSAREPAAAHASAITLDREPSLYARPE